MNNKQTNELTNTCELGIIETLLDLRYPLLDNVSRIALAQLSEIGKLKNSANKDFPTI